MKRTEVHGVHTDEEEEGPAMLVENEDGIFLELDTEHGYNGTRANLAMLITWLHNNRPDLLRRDS